MGEGDVVMRIEWRNGKPILTDGQGEREPTGAELEFWTELEALRKRGPIQMVRPPWDKVYGVNHCMTHGHLWTVEALSEHWRMGCFDYPVPNAAQALTELVAEVQSLLRVGKYAGLPAITMLDRVVDPSEAPRIAALLQRPDST